MPGLTKKKLCVYACEDYMLHKQYMIFPFRKWWQDHIKVIFQYYLCEHDGSVSDLTFYNLLSFEKDIVPF